MPSDRTSVKLTKVMTPTGPRRVWQGSFVPHNAAKYKGKSPIHVRSSWELKFMMWCDRNQSVLEWGSESAIVEYIDPTKSNSQHRYIIDFTMTVRDKSGAVKKFYIEIKPRKETQQPSPQGKKRERYIAECVQFARNTAKWKAAVEFARRKGAQFMVLNEEDLMV